jgi:hypothetical protein
MADRTGPAYGTPNWDMLGRWLELPPEQDGPFWALNLMKYKAVADYGVDGPTGASGQEADDAYAPLGPLAAVGAMVAFHGAVVEQPLGAPVWDRVGIVRYPSRAAFFAMQQRADFKDQHVHKAAGMDITIVLSCLPDGQPVVDVAGGALVLTVGRAGAGGERPSTPPAVAPVAELDVEGVIVGDDRTWTRVAFDRVPDAAALEALVAAAAREEAFVLVVEPSIDRLVESITTAPSIGAQP